VSESGSHPLAADIDRNTDPGDDGASLENRFRVIGRIFCRWAFSVLAYSPW